MRVGGIRLSADSLAALRALRRGVGEQPGPVGNLGVEIDLSERRTCPALAQLARAGVLVLVRRASRHFGTPSEWVEGPRFDEALALLDAAEARDRVVDEH